VVRLLLAAWFLTGVLVIAQGGEPPPPEPSERWYQDRFFVTQLATLVTLGTTAIWGMLRQAQQRKWDMEDRAADRDELRLRLDAERDGRQQIARDLNRSTALLKSNTEKIGQELEKNTAINVEAIKVGNNFHERAAELEKKVDALKTTVLGDKPTTDEDPK
jgi:hypothetical protein